MKSYYDKIEAHDEGSLTPEELIEFESSLKTDNSLKEALSHYKLAKEFSKTLIEFETREQLQQFKKNKFSLNWIYKIAAILLLGFICIYFLYPKLFPTNLDSDQVFASLYEKPAGISYRSETNLKNKIDTAIYQFDIGNLDQSQKLFSNIQLLDTTNLIALKYLAHIQLQNKNYDQAKLILNKIYNSSQEPYLTEALYYLCMLDLMSNNIADAKIKFELLKNNSMVSRAKINVLENYLR